MLLKIKILLFFIGFINFVNCEDETTLTIETTTSEITKVPDGPFFTITGPKTFRANSEYHIAITNQDPTKSIEVKVGIKGDIEEPAKSAYDNSKTVTVPALSTVIEPLTIGSILPGEYKLYGKGLSGVTFEKEAELSYNTKEFNVFVQTDKAIYKPGDTVRFRVVFLNGDLKAPTTNKDITVYINDASQNRIIQWKNVKLNKGVFSSELQLSSDPNLGTWEINIDVDDKTEKKTFEVDEYVLPKFEVIVDAQGHATFKEGKIVAIIRSKYTYGKYVKGEVTVSAFPTLYVGSLQPFERSIITRKVLPIDGKATAEFSIDELGLRDEYERDVIIEAVVEEELTGRKQNGTSKVTLHKSKYKIDITGETNNFKPGLPFVATVKVSHHDGSPVKDTTNKVTVEIEERKPWVYRPYIVHTLDGGSTTSEKPEELPIKKEELTLDENGMATVKVDVSPGIDNINMKAKYLDVSYDYFYVSKEGDKDTSEYIQVKVLTENPEINKEIQAEIRSTNDIKFFTYQIIGRGDILASNTVEVEKGTYQTFKFLATFSMVPRSKIIVYYINSNGTVISDIKDIEFPKVFQNPVKINLSKVQAKPGEDIDITVSTNPNSFVGLLGVDQSVLLLKSGNDLDRTQIFDSLKDYEEQTYYRRFYKRSYWYGGSEYPAFRDAGLVVLTNANPRKYEYPLYALPVAAFALPGLPGPPPPPTSMISLSFGGTSSFPDIPDQLKRTEISLTIRKEFPETWIWDTISNISYEGRTTVHKKVPDTITSWVITGFAIDPVTGFGMTQTPRKLEVFQPFFVSTNLPYSIKRGEVVAIPVVVFNYMNEDLDADVTLDNSLGEFEFAEISNEVQQPKIELSRTKKVGIKSNNGASVSFMVRPLVTGYITIKVIAKSAIAGDGVERQLLVEPEGVTHYVNKGFLIDLRQTPEFKTEIEITVPRNVVPDSTRVQVSVIGDILGPTVKNLAKLIRLPYGCGEQNMLNFVPNIVILDYLAATNQVTPEIKAKSINYMNKGYQRELTYKHDDGSYSAFGKSDKKGSTWLTAFVVKSFRQAANYIEIDENIMKQSLHWLSNQQAPNGSFPEVGKVFHKGMQGGGSSDLALTAYTLTAFLQSPNDIVTYRTTIDKALEYLLQNIDQADDIYSLTLTAYALQLMDHSSKTNVLQTLQSKANDKDGKIWWEKPKTKNDKKNVYYDEPSSVDVELTGYALLTYVKAGFVTEALPIMKWLISQRNSEGGFSSTQDTIVGLSGLASIAAKMIVDDLNIQFNAKFSDDEETTLNVNKDNSLIFQTRELPTSVRKIEIKGTGKGLAIGQVSYKYNVNVTGAWPRFTLDPQVNKNSNQDYLHLTICTAYVPDAESDDLVSNMAVMEVKFPSGFTADKDTLPSLERSQGVQKVETKEDDTIVVMYFDNLDHNELCPTVTGFRTHKVANQKPAPVVIYDYYDNTRRARVFYRSHVASLCDICEGDDCGDSCKPVAAQQKSPEDLPPMHNGSGSTISGFILISAIAILRFFF